MPAGDGAPCGFEYWNELPLALQHAVGAAVVAYKSNTAAAARAACRALRDGVDSVVTGLQAVLQDPINFQAGQQLGVYRFANLHRLSITATADSALELDDLPSALQELRLKPSGDLLSRIILPPLQLPHLRVLEVTDLVTLQHLDCSQLPALQRLVLTECCNLTHILNVATCTALTHIVVSFCEGFQHGLNAATLRALTQSQFLRVPGAKIGKLDVPSCSPSLTLLDLSCCNIGPLDLFLPGGSPRTALMYLGVGGDDAGVCPHGWDLHAVPCLEVLDVSSGHEWPANGLDLRLVPRLKKLDACGADLEVLDLQHASALEVLNVGSTRKVELSLQGYASLRKLYCGDCTALKRLELAPVAAKLRTLMCDKAHDMVDLDCAGCSCLTHLTWRLWGLNR